MTGLRRHLAGLLALAALLPALGTASDAAVGFAGAAGGSLRPDEALLAQARAGNASASAVLFADDVVAALGADARGNLVVSPASIFDALARLAPGARGASAAAMMRALHSGETADMLLADTAALDAQLNMDDTLHVASAAWLQDGYPVRDDYSALLGRAGSPPRSADFEGDPGGSREVINDWIAQNTGGRIRDMLGPDAVSALTRLVLANAIALDARWAIPFAHAQTHKADFATPGGHRDVPTMHMREVSLDYAEANGWRAVRLPYAGNRLDALVVLPDPGVDPLAMLPAVTSPDAQSAFTQAKVNLAMPRFTLSDSFDLVQALTALGLGRLFDSTRVDLSGIGGNPGDLVVGAARHRAWLSVDEGGTKGAAATALGVQITAFTGQRPPVVDFTVDRSFLFLVVDHEHGVPLFVARITDPP